MGIIKMLPGMFNTMIGGLPQINLTIAANTSNYNMFTSAGSPTFAAAVTLTINSGVVVSSSNQTSVALIVPAFPAGSVVRIINNGNVYGHGGDGGDGAVNPFTNPKTPTPGIVGSDAISISCNVSIDNTNGNIFGGGKGGSGGSYGSGQAGAIVSPQTFYIGGGGGGGGQGAGTSLGGDGGDTGSSTTRGRDGEDGDVSGPGAGGARKSASGQGAFIDNTYYGGAGFPGGSWGVGGSHAVKVNGHAVTWEGGNNSNQVKGLVS